MSNDYPYKTRLTLDEGIFRYFVSFEDGQALGREIEVSFPVFVAFQKFEKVARNLQRWDERHMDNYEFADERNFARPTLTTARSAEDEFFAAQHDEELRQAIQDLPEIQRRRFVLYYEFGLTYEQIGKLEKCSDTAVRHSVNKATATIRRRLKK